MGLGSLKVVQKLTNKVNSSINKVTGSKLFNNIMGGASQVLRRFPTPQDVANVPDPLKSFQWEVIFPSIQISLGGTDDNAANTATWLPYQPICENISFTLPKVISKTLDLGPSQVHMAQKISTATTFSAEFYCDNSVSIVSYFQAWRRLAVKDNQLVGFAIDYKKPVYLYILGVRSVIPVYLIKFKGVYPTDLKSMTFKSDSKASRVTATITFNCDLITAEPLVAGQAMTGLTNNLVGNALTNFASASSVAGLFTK